MNDPDADRDSGHGSSDAYERPRVSPHQDPERLRELYHGKGLTQAEVGERLGVDQPTISKWMDILDIETRPDAVERNDGRSVRYSERRDKRSQIDVPDSDGDMVTLYESQLVALTSFSVSEVFGDDTHIHHRLGSGEHLNLPANLEVMAAAEHTHRHAKGIATDPPETVFEGPSEGDE